MVATDEISATEAASLLGLTRERLRQLAASGELPTRVAGSSPFRPRYRRLDIEAFGRATGRISGAVPKEGMELIANELVAPRSYDRWTGPPPPNHVRVWRRDGWPPVALVGIPRDGAVGGPWGAMGLLPGIRERWLPEDDLVSFWVYQPSERIWIDRHLGRVPREYIEFTPALRRTTPSRKKKGADAQVRWAPRTQEEFEAAIGQVAELMPSELYRIDVIERVIAADGIPIEVVWDPYGLAGLIEACIVLADASERRGPDRDLLRAAAFHEANFARAIERGGLEVMPESTHWVKVVPVEFPAATWARVDALNDKSPPYVKGAYEEGVIDLKRRLRALLAKSSHSLPWALREAVQHASVLSPIDEETP